MELPLSFLDSLTDTKGFNRGAFEKIHASGEQVTSIRINPLKVKNVSRILSLAADDTKQKGLVSPVPWSRYGYYLKSRPSFTFDPFFHAGCYYVQEASSMFLEQALKQTVDLSLPLRVLDLSAAPGGKSTHIQSLVSPSSLLVSNDVIRPRAAILKDNIIKWGTQNVIVTNNDPKDIARLENYFDVIVVDAPCSGSGLFRREPDAIAEWSLNNVALCSQRQQRILADIWPALKQDGILIYSTCSYSKEEDEEIMDWLISEMNAESLELQMPEDWGITTTGREKTFGYRFWPNKIKGEGFFIACFRKKEGDQFAGSKHRTRTDSASKKEIDIIKKWIDISDHQFVKYENTVYAWPGPLVQDMHSILSNLRVVYSGVRLGELVRDKLVPDHALAMSNLVGQLQTGVELKYEQAIQYLQRKDLQLETAVKGWQLVKYEGYPLGWVNILTNRINNYYPKELRILKDSE